MLKEERAQWEWHRSPWERRPRGNALGGDDKQLSPAATPKLGKGAQDTWRFPRQCGVAGLIKPAQRHTLAGRRGRG